MYFLAVKMFVYEACNKCIDSFQIIMQKRFIDRYLILRTDQIKTAATNFRAKVRIFTFNLAKTNKEHAAVGWYAASPRSLNPCRNLFPTFSVVFLIVSSFARQTLALQDEQTDASNWAQPLFPQLYVINRDCLRHVYNRSRRSNAKTEHTTERLTRRKLSNLLTNSTLTGFVLPIQFHKPFR